MVALCTPDLYAAKAKSTKSTKSTASSTKTVVVDNKTSQFDDVFTDLGAKTADTTSADLADRVRRQRALLDNKGKADTSGGSKSSGVTGANACDADLRKCMSEKCGSDFTKCAKDSTTIWGEKIDSCRRKTTCSGHEYSLLAPEILADRDFNERMSYYNSVISCGNRYNQCIFAECGTTLEKCLSKSDGDRAVSKCGSVAKECKEQDSGLAARVMSVFGDLRTVAQKQAKADEARLYELRDLMRTQCNRLGAMFDERTLDCVYTVNFFSGDNSSNPTASKKLYAGDSFQCTPNWFGIDVTTFKENAYRLTRSQTAASSAMLGAGVGVAAGLVSSGALGRALDTQKAEKAAKQECEDSGGTWKKGECTDIDPEKACTNSGGTWENGQCTPKTNPTGNNAGFEGGQADPEKDCTDKGRVYSDGTCTQTCITTTDVYDENTDTCKDVDRLIQETHCIGATYEQCISHDDICTWLRNAKKCIVKGTEDQNPDVYDPTVREITYDCSAYEDGNLCPIDRCIWIPENSDDPDPEKGECVDKATDQDLTGENDVSPTGEAQSALVGGGDGDECDTTCKFEINPTILSFTGDTCHYKSARFANGVSPECYTKCSSRILQACQNAYQGKECLNSDAEHTPMAVAQIDTLIDPEQKTYACKLFIQDKKWVDHRNKLQNQAAQNQCNREICQPLSMNFTVDKIRKQRGNTLSVTLTKQANTCGAQCDEEMKQTCESLKGNTWRETAMISNTVKQAIFKVENLSNGDVKYTCSISKKEDKSGDTIDCDKLCKDFAKKLPKEGMVSLNETQQNQCKTTCEPMLSKTCTDLKGKKDPKTKKIITSVEFKTQQATGNMRYICKWSTDASPSQDYDICQDTTISSACVGNCIWKPGEGCVKKKNNEVTPSSGTPTNDAPAGAPMSSQRGGACSFNLKAATYTVDPDSTIDLSHCNPDGNHYQRLQKACRKNNTLLVLMADNKTVKNHRVLEPTMEGNLFKCTARDWWTVKDVNGRFGLLAEWRSETKPSAQSCASTCSQISGFASAEDKKIADGKEFPGNKQCLEVCASKVESVCTALTGKQYGKGPVQRTEAVYRVDKSNTLRYSCRLYLKPTLN